MADDTNWTPKLVLDHIKELMAVAEKGYEQRFRAQEKATIDALASSDKAVVVLERNAEKWRDNANEWRAAMTDRENQFCRQSDYNSLKERIDKMEGGGRTRRDMTGWVLAGAAIVASIVLAVLTEIIRGK